MTGANKVMLWAGLCLPLLAVSLSCALAQAPRPAPNSSIGGGGSAAPTPAADPAFLAAQQAFEALQEDDRKAIQDALIWTGDFAGAGTGGFGPLTYRAIGSYQRRAGAAADGILKPQQRVTLFAQAEVARQGAKFTRYLDPRAGLRIGVPMALTSKSGVTRAGTRFVSADNSAILETFADANTPLDQLYTALIAENPSRKVGYKVLRPDWFVVTGESNGQRFYTRVASGPGGLRGYTFGYPAAAARDLDRVSLAVANSFDPWPASQPNAPTVATVPSTPPGPSSVVPPAQPVAPNRPVARGPIATAVVVAPGKVVTSASVDGCMALSVGRQPATIAKLDKAAGIALLDAPAARTALAAPTAGSATDGAGLAVLGFAGADPQLTVAAGEARVPSGGTTLRIFAPLQPGGEGTAVFDRHGGFVGLVGSMATTPRQVAGIVPAASYPVLGAAAIGRFLADAGVAAPRSAAAPSSDTVSLGQITAAARASVLAVECAR